MVRRPRRKGAGSLNTLMRSIGTSVASAVAGVVLAQMTTRFGPYTLPGEDGFRTVLALGAVAALIGFAIAAFIPRRRAAATPAAAEDASGTAAEVSRA